MYLWQVLRVWVLTRTSVELYPRRWWSMLMASIFAKNINSETSLDCLKYLLPNLIFLAVLNSPYCLWLENLLNDKIGMRENENCSLFIIDITPPSYILSTIRLNVSNRSAWALCIVKLNENGESISYLINIYIIIRKCCVKVFSQKPFLKLKQPTYPSTSADQLQINFIKVSKSLWPPDMLQWRTGSATLLNLKENMKMC